MPLSFDAKVAINAVASDAVSFVANGSSKLHPRLVLSENVIQFVKTVKIAGLQEEAEKILKFLMSSPQEEEKAQGQGD